MPDLYFYLYHSVQPDIEWHSKEAPTKTTILSQRNDETLTEAERKLYKNLYNSLEMSMKDANDAYLSMYSDVKKVHDTPNTWLSNNDGGDVHYYTNGYNERRVWPTPFNLPTKDKLVAKYTDD